jgi:SpoVK/Ycf46/Vps4 family AAA+-type ATPase
MDNYWFIQSWEQMCEMAPVIALLEDIDNVFNKRKSLVKNGMGFSPMTFDCLLNCIDGVQKTDGVFTIITTNDETKIDDALGVVGLHQISTRPGRIDRIVRMTNPDEDGRRKIANRILAGFQSEVEAAVTAGAEETGAQFQDRCARLALQLYWKSQERMD